MRAAFSKRQASFCLCAYPPPPIKGAGCHAIGCSFFPSSKFDLLSSKLTCACLFRELTVKACLEAELAEWTVDERLMHLQHHSSYLSLKGPSQAPASTEGRLRRAMEFHPSALEGLGAFPSSRPSCPPPFSDRVYMLFYFLQNRQRHAEVREEQQDREGRGWMSGEGRTGGEAGWTCIDFRFLFPSFSLPTPPSPP